MTEPVVERVSEVAALSRLLEEPTKNLTICTIVGAGGVGKSHLLRQVVERVPPGERGYLHLQADASRPENRRELAAVIAQMLPLGLPSPAKANRDYFTTVRTILNAHAEMIAELAYAMRDAPDEVRDAVGSLLKLGRSVNDLLPNPRSTSTSTHSPTTLPRSTGC